MRTAHSGFAADGGGGAGAGAVQDLSRWLCWAGNRKEPYFKMLDWVRS